MLTIRYRRNAVMCPWERYEDGCFVGSFQTYAQALAGSFAVGFGYGAANGAEGETA